MIYEPAWSSQDAKPPSALKLMKITERRGGLGASNRARSSTAAVPDALSSAPSPDRVAGFRIEGEHRRPPQVIERTRR